MAVLALIGLIWLPQVSRDLRLKSSGLTATGTITGLRVYYGRHQTYYHPYVTFQVPDQPSPQSFRSALEYGNYVTAQEQVGSSVTVKYLRDDPSTAELDSYLEFGLGEDSAIAAAICALFLFFGVYQIASGVIALRSTVGHETWTPPAPEQQAERPDYWNSVEKDG